MSLVQIVIIRYHGEKRIIIENQRKEYTLGVLIEINKSVKN